MDVATITERLREGVSGLAGADVTDDQARESRFAQAAGAAVADHAGVVLFSLTAGLGVERRHVAAAAIGMPGEREFLILSMPVEGGQVAVEPAEGSADPVALIAASYAGLVDALAAA
jgi:hypothetical protein